MTEKYENVYIKLGNDNLFWVVENGIRIPILSMEEIYRRGLRPVITVSEAELLSIPISPDSHPGTVIPGIQELKGSFKGQTMYVIGSGPSLKVLSPDEIGDGIVVAINYAIERVENLKLGNQVFSLQKDRCYVEPKSAVLLVHSKESCSCFDYKSQYVFDNETDFGFGWAEPSVVTCIGLAALFGCPEIIYLCCDSAITGDCSSLTASGEWVSERNAEQLLRHKDMVEKQAKKSKIKITWKEPKVKP